MKKVALFYTAWTDSTEKFLKEAQKENVSLTPIHYSQLVCQGEPGKWEISFQNKPLEEFGLFFFRNVGDKNELLPLLLEYAQKKKIPIIDEYLLGLGGAMRKKKSTEAGVLLAHNVPYPKTIFTSGQEELKRIVRSLPKPVIIKSTGGRHGKATFLIKKNSQLERVLLGRGGVSFLVQQYIPNDGDYRIFLIGYRAVAGFKRQPKEEKLILDRSQGKSEPLEKIPAPIKRTAEKAAKVLGVEIAGIDMVVNQQTKKPVIIEVNQAPEFYVMERRTGVNIARKIIQYLKKKCR